MQLEIISQKENKPLERMELEISLSSFNETPSRPAVIDELAKKVAGTKQCILVTKIEPRYANGKATAFAQVYSSPEALKKYGHKKLAARQPKKAAKAEEKK